MSILRDAFKVIQIAERQRPSLLRSGMQIRRRVQSITEADATAEGWDIATKMPPVEWYRQLWDDINAARGYRWLDNPWVWVVQFARVEGHSDE